MFLKNYFLKEKIKQNSYFIWNSQKKNIQTIKEFKPLNLKLIIGVDNQKEILLKNTVNFGGKKEMKPLIIWNMFKKNLK